MDRAFSKDYPSFHDRADACRVIDRKLAGQARKDARNFAHNPRTTLTALTRMLERLESLPDVPRTEHAAAQLTAAQVAAIRAARTQTPPVPLKVLAERYGCSSSLISRVALHGRTGDALTANG